MVILFRVILIKVLVRCQEKSLSVLNRDGRRQISENEQRQLFKGVLLKREREKWR